MNKEAILYIKSVLGETSLDDEDLDFCYNCAKKQFNVILSRHNSLNHSVDECSFNILKFGPHETKSLIMDGGLAIAGELSASFEGRKVKSVKRWRRRIKQITEYYSVNQDGIVWEKIV